MNHRSRGLRRGGDGSDVHCTRQTPARPPQCMGPTLCQGSKWERGRRPGKDAEAAGKLSVSCLRDVVAWGSSRSRCWDKGVVFFLNIYFSRFIFCLLGCIMSQLRHLRSLLCRAGSSTATQAPEHTGSAVVAWDMGS